MDKNMDKKLPLQLQELLILHSQQIVSIKTLRLVCKTWKQIINSNKKKFSPNLFVDNNIQSLSVKFPQLSAVDFTQLGQVNDLTVTPITRSTVSALRSITALRTINLCGQSLRYADYLYDLAQVTQVRELTLNNFFRIDVLTRFVQRARHLTKFNGLQIQANRDGVDLLRALGSASNLRYLEISLSAPFILQEQYGLQSINSLLKIQGLKKLSLRGNIAYFMEGLSVIFPRLQSLTLSLNFGVTLENIDYSCIQNLNLVKDLRFEVGFDVNYRRMDGLGNGEILIEFLPNLTSLQNLNLKNDQISCFSTSNFPAKLRELKLWVDAKTIDQIGILGDLTQLKKLHVGIQQNLTEETLEFENAIKNLRNLENLEFQLDFKQLVPNIVIQMSVLTSLTNLNIKCNDIFDPNKIIQEISQLTNLRQLHIKVQHPKHSNAHNVISTVVPLANLVNLQELVLKFLTPQNEHLKILSVLTNLKNLDVMFAKRHGDWNPQRLEEMYKMYPAIRTLTALAS